MKYEAFLKLSMLLQAPHVCLYVWTPSALRSEMGLIYIERQLARGELILWHG
jgi:hypothetical protein